MTYNIDTDTLRKQVQNKFSKQGKMKEEDINTLYDIVTEINKEKGIFIDLPEPLERLAYNLLYIQIYNRIIYDGIEYNEDIIITDKIIESIKNADTIIDIIKEAAGELHSEDKKEAFYRLMGNNPIIMAGVYILRKEFFDSSINVLCKSINIQELDDKMTSEGAFNKLCELTESGECSRLQRALDILVKHGDNLTIVDVGDDETKHSNASSLEITDDDIKSLQLLTRIDMWRAAEFSKFLNDSIYDPIINKIKQHGTWHPIYSICDLYGSVYNTSMYKNQMNTESKAKFKNALKGNLNDLNDSESVCNIISITDFSSMFNNITRNGLTADKFKNNVVKKYLESIEPIISIINGTAASFKHKFKRVLSILIIIFIIIFIIIMSIFRIFPNETKEIMNNLLF
ncbi:hypothetical protein NEQG_01926 [Nematocida parisii ERTm3]|uniref:Uncharacterized protein n=1 Tax=Nematocida parisii (strain ERTm3) TaxID=935791 RepID=I3EF57_NEMP3|nr:hypothetical protein NEQG_01926 [Nematocida parisii ERTm3]